MTEWIEIPVALGVGLAQNHIVSMKSAKNGGSVPPFNFVPAEHPTFHLLALHSAYCRLNFLLVVDSILSFVLYI